MLDLNLVQYSNLADAMYGDKDAPAPKFDDLTPLGFKARNDHGGVTSTYYFGVPFTSVTRLIPLLMDLNNASEQDDVRIIFNSPGGNVVAGQALAEAIRHTKANVITEASGICASCGSICWSLGDVLVVRPWTKIMYHMSMHGDMGKTLNILNNATCLVDQARSLYAPIIERGLITQTEYNNMINQRINIFVAADEMQHRIDALNARGK